MAVLICFCYINICSVQFIYHLDTLKAVWSDNVLLVLWETIMFVSCAILQYCDPMTPVVAQHWSNSFQMKKSLWGFVLCCFICIVSIVGLAFTVFQCWILCRSSFDMILLSTYLSLMFRIDPSVNTLQCLLSVLVLTLQFRSCSSVLACRRHLWHQLHMFLWTFIINSQPPLDILNCIWV